MLALVYEYPGTVPEGRPSRPNRFGPCKATAERSATANQSRLSCGSLIECSSLMTPPLSHLLVGSILLDGVALGALGLEDLRGGKAAASGAERSAFGSRSSAAAHSPTVRSVAVRRLRMQRPSPLARMHACGNWQRDGCPHARYEAALNEWRRLLLWRLTLAPLATSPVGMLAAADHMRREVRVSNRYGIARGASISRSSDECDLLGAAQCAKQRQLACCCRSLPQLCASFTHRAFRPWDRQTWLK